MMKTVVRFLLKSMSGAGELSAAYLKIESKFGSSLRVKTELLQKVKSVVSLPHKREKKCGVDDPSHTREWCAELV